MEILRRFKSHRIDSRMLVAFLILAFAGFVLLKLSSEVMEGDMSAFDRHILEALRTTADRSVPVGPTWLHQAMIDITALGGTTILTITTVLATGYLLAIRKVSIGLFLLGAILSGSVASSLLKLAFARPRPDLVAHLVNVHTASFPSGHAMNSAITYLTIGTLLARAEQDSGVRIYLLAVAISLSLAIGISRVYLGVHWPSDVIAGWCVGALWAVFCSLLARALQRRRAIDPAG